MTGWSLWLYNGNNGEAYNSFGFDDLSFTNTSTEIVLHSIKTNGIQNGSPDGLVLFDGVNIVQFLSYDGSFTATAGIAIGLISTNIGGSETSNTPLGFSLQLIDNESNYADFTWASPQENTFGGMNTGQKSVKPNESVIPVSEPKILPSLFVLFISILLLSKRRVFRL